MTEYEILAELRSLREKLKAGMLEASKDELMALNEAIEVMKAAVEVPTPEKRYRVKHYDADGCFDAAHPNGRPKPDGEVFPSYTAARDAISAAVGDHGQWADDAGNVHWHESDREGCGGFCIVEVKP